MTGRQDGDILDRTRAVLPQVRARRDADAQARDVSAETIRAFDDAGLLGLLRPRRWGGAEADPRAFFDAQNLISEQCMSTAWVFGVLNVQAFVLALFDDAAQADVWGGGGSGLVSSAFKPGGTVMRVDGGYRLAGRWTFSSGGSHCAWALLGGVIPPVAAGDAPEMRLFLVPRRDYAIVDTWQTFGLRATGSNDIHVDGAIVPAYRTWRPDAGLTVAAGPSPLPPLYRLPWLYLFSGCISNLSIGAGRGALRAFAATLAARPARPGPSDPALLALAQGHAEVDAAEILVRRHVATMMAHADAEEAMPLAQALLFRTQLTSITRSIAAMVDRLMLLSGGGGIRDDAPLARYWLDLCAARHHPGNNPDAPMALLGAELLGAG